MAPLLNLLHLSFVAPTVGPVALALWWTALEAICVADQCPSHDSQATSLTACCLIISLSSVIFIGPRCPWGPIYGSGPMSVSHRLFAGLTDVTLADEDSNLIPTDDVHRAIRGNVAMQVAPSGAQH